MSVNMKPGTMERISEHVRHARNKHPEWRKTPDYAFAVAELEWNEIHHALRWETQKRVEEEALDLIAVLIRIIEGDHR